MRSRQAPSRLGPDGAERISAGAYGLLVAASTLLGLGSSPTLTIIAVVVVTNLIYYATHVFAYTIGSTEGRIGWVDIQHHLYVSAPMFSAAFAPLAIVLIGLAFGADTRAATLFGVIGATLLLSVEAVIGMRLRGIRGWPVLAVAAGTVVAATVLILAKALLLP